jgi:hypothetical protein
MSTTRSGGRVPTCAASALIWRCLHCRQDRSAQRRHYRKRPEKKTNIDPTRLEKQQVQADSRQQHQGSKHEHPNKQRHRQSCT